MKKKSRNDPLIEFLIQAKEEIDTAIAVYCEGGVVTKQTIIDKINKL